MKESIKNILRENIQQADKIYFNTGKLPKEARDAILSITNGDVYTKLIADLVYHFSKFGSDLTSGYKLGQKLYKQIREYDKNVLPLPYNILDFNAEDSGKHIMNLMEYLEYRERALFYLKQLPSTLVRNLKPELRKPVTHQYDFQRLAEKLKELWGLVKHIPETEKGEKALKKVAASSNSIDDMIELANHFAYAFNDRAEDTTKEDVLETAEEYNQKVLQDSNDILMIKVDDHEAMKALGCTSVWCFSLPTSDDYWEEYVGATGYVIVIFDFKQDFDDSTFLMVYLPDRGDVYSATNVPLEQLGIEASNEYLQKIGVDMSKLYEPDAPEPHYDPNQLSLDLKEAKNLIKSLLRENLLTEMVSDITYHFNYTKRAIQILESNKINLSPVFGSKYDKSLNKDKLFFLSTTSSRSSDIGYAASLSKDGLVRFTLNGRALNHNYTVTRIDYWQRSKDPKDPSYNPHGDSTGKSFYKNISRQDELEDRLISDKNEIKPANKYIMVLEVLNGSPEDLSYMKQLADSLSIQFYAYDNEAYFNASAKGKAIEVQVTGEKPESRPDYTGDMGDLAAYVVYKDDALRAKMMADLKKMGVDTDALNEKIEARINDKLKYYLRDDDYYLNDFSRSMESNIHNYRSSTNEAARYIIRQLGLDMKRNGTDTVKDYLRYKVYKGKKTQKTYNEELNKKFMDFIDNEVQQLLARLGSDRIRFTADGKDYDNLLDYKPFTDLLNKYVNQIKAYVTEFMVNNDDMFRLNYMLSSSYIRDHLKIDKKEIANVLNTMEFDSDYVSVDDVNAGLVNLIYDFDNYQYQEIKNAQTEYHQQFNS